MKNKLRLRLWLSIIILLSFFVGSIYFFNKVKHGVKVGGAPTLLRKGFIFNENVWSKIYSNKKFSVSKPIPPKGKKPRVNGMFGLMSKIDIKNYRVQIFTDDKENMTLPISAFYSLPKSGYSTDFRCIEGWSEEIQYGGARFSDFLKFYQLGKKSDGTYYSYVGLSTPDDKYYVSIDMESMLHDQTVLAYEMNEAPLSLPNGAPLRLIIPVKYGIKSLKRIGKITFSDLRLKDYWAERGYDWYSGL